LKSIVSQY